MIAYLEKKTTNFLAKESNRLKFPAHLHRHVEFVALLEATATAYADTERCDLRVGDAFIAFPNQVHRYDPPVPGEHSMIIIVDPDMMPELSHVFFESKPQSSYLENFVTDEILSVFKRLMALSTTTSSLEDVERRALLTALFSRVLAACRPTEQKRGERDAVRDVVSYCSLHYTDDLSLAVLEQELHISRYYISHVFADKLKIGFNDYVNSLRVSHACRYLRQEDRAITEISALVGFSNPRTFNRAFIKCMNMTPSEYRKQQKE